MFNELKKLVVPFAPTLATMLGGPLAGLAVKTLSKGISATAKQKMPDDENEIVAELVKIFTNIPSGDVLKGITQAEKTAEQFAQEHKEMMARIAVEQKNAENEEYRISTSDTKDARATALKAGMAGPYIFGTMIWLIFGALIYAMLFHTIPESNEQIIYVLVGSVSGTALAFANFVFGSSKGSKEKTQAMQTMAHAIQNPKGQ